MQDIYDYIIVGGGSAGCVIATRLIERTSARVLLLEAGPCDNDLFIHMPAGVPQAIAKHTYSYVSPANPATGLPDIALPQGHVLGGGSSVNAMVYVRGTSQDYDDWEQRYGCTGWGHKDVLPYFIRAERNESLSAPNHGTEGHLWVSEPRYRHPLSMTFVRAGQELGLPYLPDISGAQERPAVGMWQRTIHNGERASTVYAYLRHVIDDKRLTLVTDASVEKILIEHGKAVGVHYSVKGRAAVDARAEREVIVTAGAVGSPKLLLLSGIGPIDELQALDIPVVVDSPQVGKNLQDHLLVPITAETPSVPSILRDAKGLKKIAAGIEWLGFHHDGIVGSNGSEGGGYLDINGDGRIDTQIFVVPAIPMGGPLSQSFAEIVDGITLEVAHVYPESRGEVRLTSADPSASPSVQANYLSAQGDLDSQVLAMKEVFKFFDTPSLKSIVQNINPPVTSTEDELAAYFRQHCSTVFHPTSTCRMGAAPEDSVVDLQLRVWGVGNLRVADSSVMPHIVSGNINAPTIMIAERAVDMILADGGR